MLDDPRLLVVDDEEVICEGCRRIFSRQGFEVEKCSDACQGLSLAKQNDYSAILLDIKMPTMDGIAFLEALRKQKADVPVVLMTGLPQHPQRGIGDPPGGLRLRDEALHAGRNHAGRTPPAAPRSDPPAARCPRLPNRRPRPSPSASGATPGSNSGTRGRRGSGPCSPIPRPPRSNRSACRGSAKWSIRACRLAAVTVADKPQQFIPAPLSGVVVAVNEALKQDPALLLSDPCGKGWIACISATRAEDEAANCLSRRVTLYNPDVATAQTQAGKLRRPRLRRACGAPTGPN